MASPREPTAPPPRTIRFPAELVHEITDNLRADKKTLANAALLSQDWALSSRRYLFHTITLSDRTIIPGETAYEFDDHRHPLDGPTAEEKDRHFQRVVCEFANFLEAAPASIIRNVRALTLTVGDWRYDWVLTLEFPQLWRIVQALPRLEELTLHSIVIRSCSNPLPPKRRAQGTANFVLTLSCVYMDDASDLSSVLSHFPDTTELHWYPAPIWPLEMHPASLGEFGRSLRLITQRQISDGNGPFFQIYFMDYDFLTALVTAMLAKHADLSALTLDVDMVLPYGSTNADPVPVIKAAGLRLDTLVIRAWVGNFPPDTSECCLMWLSAELRCS